jgi:hypothetical protein
LEAAKHNRNFSQICEPQKQLAKIKRMGTWQMARNDDKEILALETEASQLGLDVVVTIRDLDIATAEQLAASQSELMELGNQFREIASHLMPERMTARTPAERKRVRQEISKRTKELSDVVKAKHTQRHLAFSCIDLHDECMQKRKRQRKSTYLCFLALFICLGSSMKGLLATIAAAAAAGPSLT